MTRTANRMADVAQVMRLHRDKLITRPVAIERIVRLIDETPAPEREPFIQSLRRSRLYEAEAAVEEWRWREKQEGAL